MSLKVCEVEIGIIKWTAAKGRIWASFLWWWPLLGRFLWLPQAVLTAVKGGPVKGVGVQGLEVCGEKVQIGEGVLRYQESPKGTTREEARMDPADWPMLSGAALPHHAGNHLNMDTCQTVPAHTSQPSVPSLYVSLSWAEYPSRSEGVLVIFKTPSQNFSIQLLPLAFNRYPLLTEFFLDQRQGGDIRGCEVEARQTLLRDQL